MAKKTKYVAKKTCHYCKKVSYGQYHTECNRLFIYLSIQNPKKTFKGIQRILIKTMNKALRDAKNKTREVYKPLLKMVEESQHVRIEGLKEIRLWVE